MTRATHPRAATRALEQTKRKRRTTIVLPTYCEEGIRFTLDRLVAHLARWVEREFEIIVVDDSHAAEHEDLRAYACESRRRSGAAVVRVLRGPGLGKGAAVRCGLLAARGDVVVVMDADLPVDLDHVAGFAERIEAGEGGIVIGERPTARNEGRWLRFLLSYALLWLQRIVVFNGYLFEDTQCGFKAYRADIARALASLQRVDGGMYDIEHLYAATARGIRVARVSVTPRAEVRESKIRPWVCLRRDPFDILALKLRGLRGGYRLPTEP